MGGWVPSVRKADTPQQIFETWVLPQAVHAWINMKVDKPVGVLFVGFLQVFNRARVFSQAKVDPGKKVGCDVFLPCQFCQIMRTPVLHLIYQQRREFAPARRASGDCRPTKLYRLLTLGHGQFVATCFSEQQS